MADETMNLTQEQLESVINKAVDGKVSEAKVELTKAIDERAKEVAKEMVEAREKEVYGSALPQEQRDAISKDFFNALGRKDTAKLSEITAREKEVMQKANLQEDTDAEGGFLVPTPTRQGILESVVKYGLARQYGMVVPMASKTLKLPKLSTNGSFSVIAEEGEYLDAAPGFGNVTLTAKKVGGLVKLSEELLADATVALIPYINQIFARYFAKAEDTEFFTGSANFTGILNNTDVITKVLASGNTSYEDVDWDDLLTASALLEDGIDDGARFFFHKTVFASLLSKKAATTGTYHFAPPSAGMGSTIWGQPYSKSAILPKTTAAGSQAGKQFAIYGNLKNYMLGDRQTMYMKVLDQLYAANGQIGLRVDERISVAAGIAEDLVVLKTAA